MMHRYNGNWIVSGLSMRLSVLAEHARVSKRRLEAKGFLSEIAGYLWAHDRAGRLPRQETFDIAYDECLMLKIHRDPNGGFEVIGCTTLPQEESA